MALFEKLQALGCRLRIIQAAKPVEPGKERRPRKITTRSVSLECLAGELRQPSAGAAAAGGLPAFKEVFRAAGIEAPAHGWTVERLMRFCDAEGLGAMDRKAAQERILAALAADGAEPGEIVKDALARDRVLDEYERVANGSTSDATAARAARMAEIDAEMARLAAERKRLAAEAPAEDERCRRWHAAKADYERGMARAIGYLVENPGITIDP